jgi:hypothetical protein
MKELIVSKVGLSQQMAEQSVDTVLEYIKSNPQQVTSLLQNVGIGEGITDKVGDIFGK